jgi:RNA polymerase sigma factor (sigma-70 family)
MITRKAEKACDEPFDEMVCWRQLKNDDRQGLEGLYVRYSRELFRYGMAVQSDRDLIKDCIQELFIDLWKYRKSLRDTVDVKIYLCKSLSHKIFRQRKLEKRRLEQDNHEICSSLYPSDMLLTELPEPAEEDGPRLARAISKLPERQREIIQYVFFEQLSSAEVSKKMGIGVQSVYTLTWKAIAKLKKSFLSILM